MTYRGVALAVLALAVVGCVQGLLTGDCMQDALARHNELRKRHGAPELVWDNALMNKEKEWVTQLANSGCGLNHWGGPENLYWNGRDVDGACGLAVDSWYAERKWYSFTQTPYTATQNNMQSLQQTVNSQGGSFRIMTGHFTQLIWAKATKIGCWAATSECGVVVGCAYDTGNMLGADTAGSNQNYFQNVKAELNPAGDGNCPDDALSTLNSLRKVYGAVDLSWDTALAAHAKAYAIQQANQGCSFDGSHELSLAAYITSMPLERPCAYGAQEMFGERKNIFNPALPQANPQDWTQRSSFPTVAWRAATKVGCYVARGPAQCVVMACKFDQGQDQVFDGATVTKNVATDAGAPVIAPPGPVTGGKDKDAQCKSDAAGGWCTNGGYRNNGDVIATICPESCGPVIAAAAQKQRQDWLDAAAALGPDTAENTYNGPVPGPTPAPAPGPAPTPAPGPAPGPDNGPSQDTGNNQIVDSYERFGFFPTDAEAPQGGPVNDEPAKQRCEDQSGGPGSCEALDNWGYYPLCSQGYQGITQNSVYMCVLYASNNGDSSALTSSASSSTSSSTSRKLASANRKLLM